MCGIGLIASGAAIEGRVFSSETASSGASSEIAASEVAEAAHPNIEDLCVALKRRGPDHIGVAILHVRPLKQHLETWNCTNVDTAVHGDPTDAQRSESVTICKEKEVVDRRVEIVPSLHHETTQAEPSNMNSARLHFVGATLQLRGEHPVMQPLKDPVGNLLVYNGEVFGGLVVRGNENDTAVLMAALSGCCVCTCHSNHGVSECHCLQFEFHQTIPQVLSRLRGPWAVMYWQSSIKDLGCEQWPSWTVVSCFKNSPWLHTLDLEILLGEDRGTNLGYVNQAVSQTLWFGRDAIGRRSLLIHQPSRDDRRLLLTSVAPTVREDSIGSLKYWEELACGIYSIGYSVTNEGETRDRLPGGFASEPNASSVVEEETFRGLRQETCLTGWVRAHSWQNPWLRTLLAWERRQVIPIKMCSPETSQSDQLNNPQGPTAENTLEPKYNCPFDRQPCQTDPSGECALNDTNWQANLKKTEVHRTPVEQVLTALREAVKRRTIHIRRNWGRSQLHTNEPTTTESNSFSKATAPIAVLFSGGLDSMILAALADEFVDLDCCIDLLNVSFDGDSAPDRITAVTGVAELQEVFPSRRWRLIEINSELSDLTEYRVHLQSLICPSNTYMDLNIGTALWLAASGEGYVHRTPSSSAAADLKDVTGDFLASDSCNQEYELVPREDSEASGEKDTSTPIMVCKRCHVRSEARVLLVGSGADEQCGGYGRHRTKFRLGGWKSLEAEMRLDFNRIWKRNLGRDDRCIADQGKEARFPFLDEDVVSTLLGLPLWDVVDLRQPAGIGDKKILRQVAQALGLKSAASLPKRAIQFGSRIARESNRKDFGSNRAANQASAGSAILKKMEQQA